MTDSHTPHGARKLLAARNYADAACHCALIREGICGTCFNFQACGAEVDLRMTSGLVTGHSTEPLVFPKAYGAGLRVTRAALDRIKPAAKATTRDAEPLSLGEAELSGNQGSGAASKREQPKK